MSEAVDKLIASGSFNRDEIRVLTGFEPIGSEEMQKFIITKTIKLWMKKLQVMKEVI